MIMWLMGLCNLLLAMLTGAGRYVLPVLAAILLLGAILTKKQKAPLMVLCIVVGLLGALCFPACDYFVAHLDDYNTNKTAAVVEETSSPAAEAPAVESKQSQDDYNAVVQDRLDSAAAKGLKEYADTLHIDSVDFVSEPSDSGKLIAIVNCSGANGSHNEYKFLYGLSKAIFNLDDIPFDMVYYHRIGDETETEMALSKKNADSINLGKEYDGAVFNQHVDYQCKSIGGQPTSKIGRRPDGI